MMECPTLPSGGHGERYEADSPVLDRRTDRSNASEKEKVALGKIRRPATARLPTPRFVRPKRNSADPMGLSERATPRRTALLAIPVDALFPSKLAHPGGLRKPRGFLRRFG
jgi:hypothetical protein